MRLCYNCGASGHLSPRCPERPSSAQVGGGSWFFSLLVPVSLCASNRCVPVSALTDSGAAVNLINGALVERLGIPTFPCVPPLRITAIDSHLIGEGYLKRQTELLNFRVGLFHHERLVFYVTSSTANPMILGFLWLRRHDPQISWRLGELVRWSPACKEKCLRDQVPRPCRTSCVREPPLTIPGHPPQEYAEFRGVFSEERVARLPAHQPWGLPSICCLMPLRLGDGSTLFRYLSLRPWRSTLRPPWQRVTSGHPRHRQRQDSFSWAKRMEDYVLV
ncbi:hypothetical protein QTP70_002850 [Hemibagrus guttatus]|uniref:CCHC-type domain-containing protein n=1 Tax=Hemibagrus guttatus TaxID=175788 RepID=A0AAE0QS95_9TELE|nr:hypothetical protein QTP70_002850 [Hemibagrus guttatus]